MCLIFAMTLPLFVLPAATTPIDEQIPGRVNSPAPPMAHRLQIFSRRYVPNVVEVRKQRQTIRRGSFMGAKKAITICVMAALAVCAAGTIPGHAAEKIDVALNWTPGGDHAPLYYAKKMGWFRDADLDVTLEAGKGSAGSVQRVAVNSAQIGLVDMGVVLTSKAKDANVVAIFNIYANSALGMYWLKSSGIKSVADFAGKKIGVPPGDAQRALWPALAKANKVDPGAVTWVNIDPTGKLPALKSRAVDVTTNFYNLHHIMSRELGEDMGFLSWPTAGMNPYGLSIVANGEFLKSKREAVAKFTKITQKAYGACAQEPKPCVEALVESVGALRMDNETVNWQLTMVLMSDTISRSVALGWMDPKRMDDDYELVKTYLGLDKPFDVKTVYTNEFLDPSIKMIAVPEPKFN
jgi:NitT/TauT family transport system substrate-binding protein